MNPALAFQFSLYTLTALAGGMLAFGEGGLSRAWLSLPLCCAAWFFNERWAVVRIPKAAANFLGVAALVGTGVDFFGPGLVSRLLAGAHLLVYLTWILLFQKKDVVHYWWLCALGVLQVAVGSILTVSGWFGLCLIVYVLLAIWTLAVFSLYQGYLKFAVTLAGETRHAARPAAPIDPNAARTARLARLFSNERRSEVRNTVRHDARERWINARFVGGILGLACLGTGLGLTLFLLVPRLWFGDVTLPEGSSAALANRAVTGASDRIHLGDLGEILESNERVLRFELFDDATGRRLELDEFLSRSDRTAPLMRGKVLDYYSNGEWTTQIGIDTGRELPEPAAQGFLRQEIRLEPTLSEILFAMRPISSAVLNNRSERVMFEPISNTLYWLRRGRFESVNYTVLTPPAPRKPAGESVAPRRFLLPRQLRPFYLQLPRMQGRRPRPNAPRAAPPALVRLRRLAAELTSPDRLPEIPDLPRDVQIARALTAHLRDSGQFKYTLNTALIDPALDPVEDFLFNRKEGHCEYYATALTLLLRAAGVPARVVNGFKGAQRAGSSGEYEVQQRHAHSWTEAYLGDHWVELDATPSARDESVSQPVASPGKWATVHNSLWTLWMSYVVSLNIRQQEETFYDPLKRLTRSASNSIGEIGTGTASVAAWLKSLWNSPRRWFSWEGGLVAFFLTGVVWCLIRAMQALPRVWQSLRRQWSGGVLPRHRLSVEFYERYLKLLQGQGLQRTASQTPREFALVVRGALVAQLTPAGLDRLPQEITERFYQVRFGAARLSDEEHRGLACTLAELESCLKRPPTGTPPPNQRPTRFAALKTPPNSG